MRAAVALTPSQLAARTYPPGLPGAKSRLVVPLQGVLCSVRLPSRQAGDAQDTQDSCL